MADTMRIERQGSPPPLTPRVEQFLRDRLAGVSLDEIVNPESERADYSCLDGQLVIEIKTLAEDASERVGNITDELERRPDWPIFFGSVPLEACLDSLEGDTEQIKLEIINRIGRSTIRHLRKADKQLRSHCAQFPRPDVVRMVILINEDHADYDPQTVAYVLQHELKRWTGDGPNLANIDSVIYLSERHAATQDGLVMLPVLSVEGYGSKVDPWKSNVVTRVVEGWAEWNGIHVLPHDDQAPEFEVIEVIPEIASADERWRIDYRRRPSLRQLSLEQLRDEFDDVVVMTLLFGMKSSPRKITPEQSAPIFERWAHVNEELKYRHLPMDKVQHDWQRLALAARRMRLGEDVVEWILGLPAEAA